MSVFNFKPIAYAAKELERISPELEIVIAGTGSGEQEIKRLFSSTSNVVFPGWVDSNKLAYLCITSDLAILPMNTTNYENAIPNKAIDASLTAYQF